MSLNKKLTKQDLIDTIKFMENESERYRLLYDNGVDIMGCTESYNEIIHKQMKMLWGEVAYDWMTYYVYESRNGGYDSDEDCGICYSIDSMWKYFTNRDYHHQYMDDLKYFVHNGVNTFYVIDAVSVEMYYKIANKVLDKNTPKDYTHVFNTYAEYYNFMREKELSKYLHYSIKDYYETE